MRRLLALAVALALPAVLCFVLGAATVALAAGPSAGTRYAGRTSQHRALALRISSTARTVRTFSISWRAPCRLRDRADEGSSRISFLRIRPDRRFGNRGSFRSASGGGLVAYVTESLRGRFTPRGRAFGSFTASAVFRRRGRYVTRCRTGRVRWSARARRG